MRCLSLHPFLQGVIVVQEATGFLGAWVWLGPAGRYVTCWKQLPLGVTAEHPVQQVSGPRTVTQMYFLPKCPCCHNVDFALNQCWTLYISIKSKENSVKTESLAEFNNFFIETENPIKAVCLLWIWNNSITLDLHQCKWDENLPPEHLLAMLIDMIRSTVFPIISLGLPLMDISRDKSLRHFRLWSE